MANYPHGVEVQTGKVHLEQGKPYKLEVEYQRTNNAALHLKLVWGKIDRTVDPAVVRAAQERGCGSGGGGHHQRAWKARR